MSICGPAGLQFRTFRSNFGHVVRLRRGRRFTLEGTRSGAAKHFLCTGGSDMAELPRSSMSSAWHELPVRECLSERPLSGAERP